METGYGAQPNMGQNNPGNVGNLGHGHWQNYQSPAQFVSAYVASMKADFPYFAHPVSGTPTVADVFGGHQRYAPGTSSYNTNVSGGFAVVAKVFGMSQKEVDRLMSGSPIKGAGQVTPGGLPSTGSILQSLYHSAAHSLSRVLWLVVGLALIALGVWMMIAGSPKQEIVTEKRSD